MLVVQLETRLRSLDRGVNPPMYIHYTGITCILLMLVIQLETRLRSLDGGGAPVCTLHNYHMCFADICHTTWNQASVSRRRSEPPMYVHYTGIMCVLLMLVVYPTSMHNLPLAPCIRTLCNGCYARGHRDDMSPATNWYSDPCTFLLAHESSHRKQPGCNVNWKHEHTVDCQPKMWAHGTECICDLTLCYVALFSGLINPPTIHQFIHKDWLFTRAISYPIWGAQAGCMHAIHMY